MQHGEVDFRQITVMFSDLVGSTQLSEMLDPEDLQKTIEAYRAECSTAIRRYGGEVARYFGDGVMAIFKSHEDDAARAIHAALEIVSKVPKISGPVTLTCRVGISTGPVVVGEIEDSGTWSMDAVGEHTEYRGASAEPCSCQYGARFGIDEASRVSAAFDCQDLGFKESLKV